MSFSSAILQAARADLQAGVVEEPAGSNDGPVVRSYLQAVGAPAPNNWCAAGLSAWIRRAAAAFGIQPPIQTAGAQNFWFQLEGLGIGRSAQEVRQNPALARPGSIIVWRNADPSSWRGHVGIIERREGRRLFTIEANAGPTGDRVARMERSADDYKLMGVGNLDDLGLVADTSALGRGLALAAGVAAAYWVAGRVWRRAA